MKRLLGAAALTATTLGLMAPAPAQSAPRADDFICLWDVPNQAGGVCLPGLDPVTKAVEDLLKSMRSGQTARAFSL
ncbi:MAG: hypothetical protein H0W25_03790 [Acidimicrobiia bacterium]|nr:hypothetical protein [Acidimicrobiia bacterium]